MANITLTICAESAEEYHSILRGLAGISGSQAGSFGTASEAQYADADKGEPEKLPRTRRTKEQIAADNAQAPQSGQPTTAQPNNTLADQIKQAAAEVEAEAQVDGSPTAEDVTNVLKSYAAKFSMVHAQNKLKELAGVGRVSELASEKYAEVIAAFNVEL